MPIFTYECDACQKCYEHIFLEFGHEKDIVPCPACGKLDSVRKLLTVPAYPIFKEKKGTDRENNWDYVFRVNHEKAQAEGRAARGEDGTIYPNLPGDVQ